MGHALDYLKHELVELETNGLLLHPRTMEGPTGARATFDGRSVINLASNNYLGLSNHPRMNRAAADAAERFGAGTGAVRTIAGQMRMHLVLEERFADAERLLTETAKPGRRQLLITDGVFSMDGDIAPLGDLVEVAERRDAIMMIDDAHASGVLGTGGAGTVDHFGLHGRVDIQVGTLSKAIGVLGGFTAGPQHLIEWLQNRGRPYLFSTSPPPPVVAACIEALEIIRDEPDRLERLWSNTRFLKDGLHELGFDTGGSETPITPVITGDEPQTQAFARRLFEEGVFCPAIVFPTVGRGKARVRTIVTADHSEPDLAEALAAFERVGKELGLVGG